MPVTLTNLKKEFFALSLCWWKGIGLHIDTFLKKIVKSYYMFYFSHYLLQISMVIHWRECRLKLIYLCFHANKQQYFLFIEILHHYLHEATWTAFSIATSSCFSWEQVGEFQTYLVQILKSDIPIYHWCQMSYLFYSKIKIPTTHDGEM